MRDDDRVIECGRSWARPPQLYIVRETEARAPIAPRLQAPSPRPRGRDGVAFGLAVSASMLVGAVLIALAMGWLK